MSEPEQCIICLDPLPLPSSSSLEAAGPSKVAPSVTTTANTPSTASTLAITATTNEATDSSANTSEEDLSYLNIVAALDGCEHIIHDACIRSWAKKTNTCPICRNPFHTVRVYNGVDGKSIMISLFFLSFFPPLRPVLLCYRNLSVIMGGSFYP